MTRKYAKVQDHQRQELIELIEGHFMYLTLTLQTTKKSSKTHWDLAEHNEPCRSEEICVSISR